MSNDPLPLGPLANSSFDQSSLLDQIRPLLPYLLASAAGSLGLGMASKDPKTRLQNALLGALAGPFSLAGSQILLSVLKDYVYPGASVFGDYESRILDRYYDKNRELRTVDTVYRTASSPLRYAPVLIGSGAGLAALLHGVIKHWPQAVTGYQQVSEFKPFTKNISKQLQSATTAERLGLIQREGLPSIAAAFKKLPKVNEALLEQYIQEQRTPPKTPPGQGGRGGRGGRGGKPPQGKPPRPQPLTEAQRKEIQRYHTILSAREGFRRLPWLRIGGGAAATALGLYLLGKVLPSRLVSREDEPPTGLDIALRFFS